MAGRTLRSRPAGREAPAHPDRPRDDLLRRAVDEAVRLLDADGAMAYRLDPDAGFLRFAHEAGIHGAESRAWIERLELPIGTGMFGRAVAERTVVSTDDYPNDPGFPHAREPDRIVEDVGIRSMIVAPLVAGDEVFGALGTFSTRVAAFDAAHVALVRSLADHAAAAMANARLIDELDRSRESLARRAEAEQALREISARLTSIREPGDLLQRVVDESIRLVRADGAILDLLDPETGILHWAFDAGLAGTFTAEETAQLWIELGVGATGEALAENRVIVAGDDLVERFPVSAQSELFFGRTGFRSLIAAPIVGEGGRLGVLEVYSRRPDAFATADADLIMGLANQAAVAIANARLFDALERSREENARRADSERTLREIAARVSAILDPAEVLQLIVREAARLLGSDGARIDLYDEALGALRWVHATGDAMRDLPDWAASGGIRPRQAVSGLAFAEQRPIISRDFLADDRFEVTPPIAEFVTRAGIRSVMSAPLAGDHGPLGTISVVSRSADAYREGDAEVLTALATHATIAITNAHLIEELARSRGVIERRAAAEQALRELAARITAIREPGDLLQHVVDEAARLLRADGAMIDLYDPTTGLLHWAYDSGLPDDERERVRRTTLRLGQGVAGTAVAERRVVVVDDYLAADWFVHDEATDALVRAAGMRSLVAAPIVGDDGPLGALEVYRLAPGAFDELDAATLGGLADQAAVAMTNAHLIEELARSREDVARRAEREQALREIAARITSLQDPAAILDLVVEEAMRLLGSDGAHLTRMADDGPDLVPVVVAGSATDAASRAWLTTQRFPLGGGINGLAAVEMRPVWTADYAADARIPHEPDDVIAAERLGLVAMAAAPLRAPGGEVLGTLAISYREPRDIGQEELDLLQGLADQAAIALANSSLLERLRESEERYRRLSSSSPDLVFATDAEGRYTFLSDRLTAILGHDPELVVGRSFMEYVAPSDLEVALSSYHEVVGDPGHVKRARIAFRHADGRHVPMDVNVVATVEDGRLTAIHGVGRDVSERERLERELRQSEARYRSLVSSSPDLVLVTDAEGRLTFVSEAVEAILGRRAEELVGRPYCDIFAPESWREARSHFRWMARHPGSVQRSRIALRHADGREVTVDINGVGMVDAEGRFSGVHGALRDVSEHDRLERDLRRQAAELAASEERAHLARELHDSVTQALFSMTLVARSVELLLDRDPAAARDQLAQLRDLQREALAEMRALIFELRPGNVEHDGLVHALRTHAAALQGRLGLPIVVESTVVERLPLEVEEALYRISQEALHNVVKHAAARQVRLVLRPVTDGVRLRIEDDGRGFDPAAVGDGHLGLTGMEARAARIGGRFSCRSEPGRGTTVEVHVPIGGAAETAPGPTSVVQAPRHST